MRWPIIRLIWLRDLRDQLRDRRTVFMIVLLPLVLYPALSVAVMQFAFSFGEKPSTIGIIGPEGDFPPRTQGAKSPYPALVTRGAFAAATGTDVISGGRPLPLRIKFLAGNGRAELEAKDVDLVISAPPDFWEDVERDRQTRLNIQGREDARSLQARTRFYTVVLPTWNKQLKQVRLLRRGVPASYDEDPVLIHDPELAGGVGARAGEGLFGLLVKIFPFMLVMWALAGALYPAVDVCAGEKERGTMETLIISPASREEIVLGKFLTIWVFSAGTSVLNLASMGLTAWLFGSQLTGEALRPVGLAWCVALLLPLSAFFSALCLAVGAYARSSKEGQYYLMPLFLVTMPLVFLTLAPGVELSPFYSLVPVTGVALLMQRLMGAAVGAADTWLYFVPVLAPMALYSWLSLRWAIDQFQREQVLFREAERLDVGLWLRGLFRDKETWPSAGQAAFCFAVIMGLRWLALGLGSRLPLLAQSAVSLLALVGAPAVFMALLLTTRPARALGLRRASPGAMLTALLLAGVVIGPLVQVTHAIYDRLSIIKEMVEDSERISQLFEDVANGQVSGMWAFLALVVLPAVCEELAFRGFILTGLRRYFQPWPAILLGGFLFSLYHMNVFQLLPTFILGVVLGVLTVRFGSVLPAMLFHFLHNSLLVWRTMIPSQIAGLDFSSGFFHCMVLMVLALCTLLACLLFWRLAFQQPLPGLEEGGQQSMKAEIPDPKSEIRNDLQS
jgi:sodium transport system permease protein